MDERSTTIARSAPEYEAARQRAVWNDLKPDRYPDVIVQARSEADVLQAVRDARERGLRVKARSGGHSWTASGVRDGGVLVDLSQLKDITFDADTGMATVQPGVYGGELNQVLEAEGRFFPSGHCPTVGLGGFLLQGGLGWSSRVYGPACASVEAIDVVTADGRLVHADADENPDILWAARGAGPGFFGIVTRFYLRTYPSPSVRRVSIYVYPIDVLDEVLRWTLENAPSVAPELELLVVATNPRTPDGEPAEGPTALQLIGSATADDEARAHELLQALETCPVLDRALVREVAIPATMDMLYANVGAIEPPGYRWAADNMWTDADPDVLVPAVREMFLSVPTPVSHILWYPWTSPPLPDAAMSLTGKLYLAAYAGWSAAADDARGIAWVTENMRRLEPLAKGISLSDENLARRKAPWGSAEAEARLEELRAVHDPDGRFHGFLTA
ncbi:FAD-binding oxidoreductase [Sphaerisporangium sp. NPDC051011]|uniref:FAD-binding oxidoreductase n=1 Tax=Sphaerisporangium sp. NPDC051011 TaxID=3155792 RepID=UPI0033D7E0B0